MGGKRWKVLLFVALMLAVANVAEAIPPSNDPYNCGPYPVPPVASFPPPAPGIATIADISRDGAHVFFSTDRQLSPQDSDQTDDVYERFRGKTRLVSTGPEGGNGDDYSELDGISSDGRTAYFETDDSLVRDDKNRAWDLYERRGTRTTLLSGRVNDFEFNAVAPGGLLYSSHSNVYRLRNGHSARVARGVFRGASPNGRVVVTERSKSLFVRRGGHREQRVARQARFAAVSSDGSAVVFQTARSLDTTDTDRCPDLYVWRDGRASSVSVGAESQGLHSFPVFQSISRDGKRVAFVAVSLEQGNAKVDALYSWDHGDLRMVAPIRFRFWSPVGASRDGKVLFFETTQALNPADRDQGRIDVYEDREGKVSLVSTGPHTRNARRDATFMGASKNGRRAFFATDAPLVSSDDDRGRDIYERFRGTTRLVSAGQSRSGEDIDAYFPAQLQMSDDGRRVFFSAAFPLLRDDINPFTDVYERYSDRTYLITGHPRRFAWPHFSPLPACGGFC
jgi:hypothetical protein